MPTTSRLLLAPLILLAAPLDAAPPPPDGAAARAQARVCFDRRGAPGVEACRQALALGLTGDRAALVQRSLTLKLAALGRWGEAVQAYQDLVLLRPLDPEAHLRLGEALLHFQGRAEDAAAALREALRLDPDNGRAQAAVGVALHALGHNEDAVHAFEEALRLDPAVLDGRPATRAVYEAAQRGEKWPAAEGEGAR